MFWRSTRQTHSVPAMPHLSGDDLQTAIAQLDQAIYNHDQWYKNVQRVLIARLPPIRATWNPTRTNVVASANGSPAPAPRH